ncbi:MAG TPA: hypothetical protein VJU61_11980, partial [Polyangiaceae bacterium]|nr:hypothetical protein [Polyangiaceae bacterium]
PLFSDGGGDYRLYVSEDHGGLTPVSEAPGFDEAGKATEWLRQNGGREDLRGRQIMLIRALHVMRVAMSPTLQFKPRAKLPAKQRPAPAPAPAEPETVST